jgi:pantoate--beta-alanine ligase
MKNSTTIEDTHASSRTARRAGQTIGLVPTMGALHAGHLSLVRRAKAESGFVVVSIFVNPLQFGPSEDFSRYPRAFEADRTLLEREGVDLMFAPSEAEMYPKEAVTRVNVDSLSERLDGKSRPGHFRGVATVVLKLFHIVEPDVAIFGQKDAAQVAIIRRMVRDLNLPVEIVVCPIVREPDGLALSSRNAYLEPGQRRQALVLSRALRRAQELFLLGERRAECLEDAARKVLAEEPGVQLDYLSMVDPDSLEPVDDAGPGTLVAVAAYVGTTRLIDNVILDAPDFR